MKSDETNIRKVSYGTDLIGLEDKNIKISFVWKHKTHIETRAKLDYLSWECQKCDGKQIKYDFQRYSTIPILDIQGFPAVLKLKKRRFQCKSCRIEENIKTVNPTFQRVFRTFLGYRKHISNAMKLPYSNAKLEATNKIIKDIKRQAFGFRNFENFKTKIFRLYNICSG